MYKDKPGPSPEMRFVVILEITLVTKSFRTDFTLNNEASLGSPVPSFVLDYFSGLKIKYNQINVWNLDLI